MDQGCLGEEGSLRAGSSTSACSPCRLSTTRFRNYRTIQCLFLLSSTSSSGRSSLRHRASIENSLLPGRKSISSPQVRLLRNPLVRMASSSAEYFRNPPTLSSSFIRSQMDLRHRSFASFYEHPIRLPRRPQLKMPSFSTSPSSLSSSALLHGKPGPSSSIGLSLAFSVCTL